MKPVRDGGSCGLFQDAGDVKSRGEERLLCRRTLMSIEVDGDSNDRLRDLRAECESAANIGTSKPAHCLLCSYLVVSYKPVRHGSQMPHNCRTDRNGGHTLAMSWDVQSEAHAAARWVAFRRLRDRKLVRRGVSRLLDVFVSAIIIHASHKTTKAHERSCKYAHRGTMMTDARTFFR